MPQDLTDEDREIIRLISEADDSGVQMELLEDCYSRGIAAGRAQMREECAQVCGAYAYDKRAVPELQGNSNGAADCAAAIRALNAPAASADVTQPKEK